MAMTAKPAKQTSQPEQADTGEHRDNSGRFTKGGKPNPTGHNQHTAKRKKADVAAYCKRNSLEAMRIIMKIARDSTASHSDRLKAANHIVDRALGRPEAAQSNAGGLLQGTTIVVDTGIRRTPLEPPTLDVTPTTSSVNGHDKPDGDA